MSITEKQLVDGSIIKDSRLARLIRFDAKSKEYPFVELLKKRSPRSYTWSCDTTINQGNLGCCTGASAFHNLVSRPRKVKSLRYLEPHLQFIAVLDLYDLAQKLDPWPGEDYEGSSVLAAAKAAKQLGFIDEYRWAFGINDMIMGVGYAPCVVGTTWYTGMYTPDADGFLHPTGDNVGGHAYLICGINLKGEYFIMKNSWGEEWGNHSHAKISFQDMDKLLRDRGESVFYVGKHHK